MRRTASARWPLVEQPLTRIRIGSDAMVLPPNFIMQNFNQLTPAEAERLALLAEECSEVIQVVGKILRHGYESRHPDGGQTNRALLETELGHVEVAQSMLCTARDIDLEYIAAQFRAKQRRVGAYLHHQSA